jgi:hypothetical protein
MKTISNLAPDGVSIPRFFCGILRPAGIHFHKTTKVGAPKKKNKIHFGFGFFFVDGFLISYFQTSYLAFKKYNIMIEIGKIQYNDMMKVGLFWESRARS